MQTVKKTTAINNTTHPKNNIMAKSPVACSHSHPPPIPKKRKN